MVLKASCFSVFRPLRSSRMHGPPTPVPDLHNLDTVSCQIPGGLAGIRERMAAMGHFMNDDAPAQAEVSPAEKGQVRQAIKGPESQGNRKKPRTTSERPQRKETSNAAPQRKEAGVAQSEMFSLSADFCTEKGEDVQMVPCAPLHLDARSARKPSKKSSPAVNSYSAENGVDSEELDHFAQSLFPGRDQVKQNAQLFSPKGVQPSAGLTALLDGRNSFDDASDIPEISEIINNNLTSGKTEGEMLLNAFAMLGDHTRTSEHTSPASSNRMVSLGLQESSEEEAKSGDAHSEAGSSKSSSTVVVTEVVPSPSNRRDRFREHSHSPRKISSLPITPDLPLTGAGPGPQEESPLPSFPQRPSGSFRLKDEWRRPTTSEDLTQTSFEDHAQKERGIAKGDALAESRYLILPQGSPVPQAGVHNVERGRMPEANFKCPPAVRVQEARPMDWDAHSEQKAADASGGLQKESKSEGENLMLSNIIDFRKRNPTSTFRDWLSQLTPQEITRAIMSSKKGTGIWRELWDQVEKQVKEGR
ncbi:hypothetical protein GUITHDRAFT_122702 [Guillardia theta CCMP2712]|uniref:Uncharacterized protein n=2 Tax=Guillardia theta TaxID=55529 RepID=L1I5C6_GUITC|nr:hypothetical protein GUITHDRAFT_122702 [Guillardia theta CCMP2712]EKX31094.1 hypothetical protein GUITHDRAFT_122702 [Guillardia theta CCMP2712]|eukprot:XP_005818074.1 hypothetical protein GUITHDRAFT_122702 [Guillardia theta CCMP2712]